MATIDYVFRIQESDWDFGPGVGLQKVMCYHQFVDADGLAADPTDPAAGAWEPFIPGPEIRGAAGDTIRVRVQNRISDPGLNFVDTLMPLAIVHWHGIELGNVHDGTPVVQRPTPTGQDYVYKFELVRSGVFWYHPHINGLVQEHLGAYGPIIVEDVHTDELRGAKIIPHADRTFHIALSDVSFQDARPAGSPHVPLANIPLMSPLFIRDIEGVLGNENFGDVLLVNGKHGAPFNDAAGNFQQFWPKGQRTTAAPIQVNEDESLAFQILNTGLHRFYKIHLAFRTGPGDWQVSDDLFWIGGQGGLLNQARAGGGALGDFRIRGRKGRELGGGADGLGAGAQSVQAASELTPGEFLLPTSARIVLAFAVQPGWTEVALRVNGFSVQNGGATADEEPTDMIIASFAVGQTVDDMFKLTANIDATTELLTNSALTTPSPLEDLSTLTAATAFDGCSKAVLAGNNVVVPAGAIIADYDPELTGGAGPSIDSEQVHWTPDGPMQPTPDNTRYVQLGDVVEWTVETTTASADHPWHLHGFSFQPIRMELNTGLAGYQTLYSWDFVEYVDSIYVPSHHRLTFRFRAEDRNYIGEDDGVSPNGAVGRWLAHCHVTHHAHRGMMMNFIVVEGCDLDEFQHVDVYLRDNTGDDGTEPQTGSISASPDVIVRPFELADPNAAFGVGSGFENSNTLGSTVELGQDNFLYARVNNRGNQPGNVTTDVYWSEPSTLVTPEMWNYIGRTDPMVVPPGMLTVSEALVWPEIEVPAEGHYCFIGVTGSQQDIKPITPEVTASYPTFATLDDFRALIRGHNNVTWRNFNVEDDIKTLAMNFTGRFMFRGAFDRDRRFDLAIRSPFRRLVLEVPFDDQLVRDLKAQRAKFDVKRRTIFIPIPERGEFRLKDLLLTRGRNYRSRFVAGEPGKAVLGETLSIAQEHVADYAPKLERLRELIRRIQGQLMELGADRNGNPDKREPLLRRLQMLNTEALRYRRLIYDLKADGRMELGRVSWLFADEKAKGH